MISSECGWRYLEAAPEDLGVYSFGYYKTSDSEGNKVVGTKSDLGSGKTNTAALISALGELSLKESSGNTLSSYAAKACADYHITVDGVLYNDWFLPSKDELNLMYVNLQMKG